MPYAFLRVLEQAGRLLQTFNFKNWLVFAIFRASAEQARGGREMSWVKHNIRLNPTQNRTLKILAEQNGKSRYAMLARIIKTGFSAIQNGGEHEDNIRELSIETGRNSARLIALERLAERSLYTACAAYVYARDAALKRGHSDAALGAEVQAAFERQCRLTEEQSDEPQ